MLESLHVKNLALIKESEVFFYPGLNILSGETGAGKSIILGSIRLALGAKAGKEFIRSGEEYALIELIFKSDKKEVIDRLREFDLPIEDDYSIFIQRKIMDGRSVAKINGETVTGKALKSIASLLINIHGQNDTAQLLDTKNYLDILDEYAGLEIEDLLRHVEESFSEYSSLVKELEENESLDKNRDRELSLAEFELNEIDSANIKAGEDDTLEDRYRLMNNSKKIVEAISRAYQAIDSEGGVNDTLDHALREVRSVLRYDDKISDIESQLSDAADIVGQLRYSMDEYMSSLEFSEAEFNEVENRLDTLNHLKNKYGNSLEDVLKYAEEKRGFIEKMADFGSYMTDLKKRLEKSRDVLIRCCRQLTDARKEKAKILSLDLERNLKQLNLENTTCVVNVVSDEENITSKGCDSVDILVSFNVGEPARSLSMVASGGELSRFMLALKAITAEKESIDTLIFDEIDSGISGKTAWNVAEKMNVIGIDHQVIAITHLAQIAAMADSHYLIEKKSDTDRTQTDIIKLSEDESINEIARLMSSDVTTKANIESARELKAQARVSKRL